jgi:hypothetical protein
VLEVIVLDGANLFIEECLFNDIRAAGACAHATNALAHNGSMVNTDAIANGCLEKNRIAEGDSFRDSFRCLCRAED